MTEILQNVQVFARRRRRRRQSYDNTSSFSSKTAKLKMCMKMIIVIQCQNPTGSIALQLSVDALSYSTWYACDKLRWKCQEKYSKSIFFFHFCIIYWKECMYISCQIKTSLKIHEKKKKHHFKKITVSRQFSVREIGNFGMDQLRDMGRIHCQWVSCVLNIGVQANIACCRWRLLSPESALPLATLSMPV